MTHTHLFVLLGGVVVGYLMFNTLSTIPPFTYAAHAGMSLAG